MAIEMKDLRSELEESKREVRNLSDELRRLKQREITLDSENQILKNKINSHNPLLDDKMMMEAPKRAENIPKLAGPSTGGSSYQYNDQGYSGQTQYGSNLNYDNNHEDDFQKEFNNYTDTAHDGYGTNYYDQQQPLEDDDEEVFNYNFDIQH